MRGVGVSLRDPPSVARTDSGGFRQTSGDTLSWMFPRSLPCQSSGSGMPVSRPHCLSWEASKPAAVVTLLSADSLCPQHSGKYSQYRWSLLTSNNRTCRGHAAPSFRKALQGFREMGSNPSSVEDWGCLLWGVLRGRSLGALSGPLFPVGSMASPK